MAGNPFFQLLRQAAPWLHRYWPFRTENPVFIVGFPRSGTTILGEIMAQTPDFYYLYEPVHIWSSINPQLDTWAYRYPIESGVLCWDAKDANTREARRLAQWFHLELLFHRRRRLVEKEPQNVFRMRWLASCFPAAKFIHIIRHGRDAALSLSEAIAQWYPPRYWECSWHYGKFRDYAADKQNLWSKLEYIAENADNYPRGLFVWLCCVFEGSRAGCELGPERYMEVRYESLVDHPDQELRRIFEFIHEPLPAAVVGYARTVLHSDSLAKPDPAPELTKAIAGEMLTELGYEI